MKLLSPVNDFVFKRIFGDRRNTAVLAAFLKAALDLPDREFDRLTIIDPHLGDRAVPGPSQFLGFTQKLHTVGVEFSRSENSKTNPKGVRPAAEKAGILDVKVHTASGIVINVEIQVVTSPELRKRFVFYPAKMITEQAIRGKGYDAIERVISIIIMNDILIPEDVDYYNEYGILNKKTGAAFSDLLTIAVLELPKLPEEPDGRGIWQWGRFFKSRDEEELKMVAEQDAGVGQAMAVLMELSEDEQTRLLAESREKFLWDQWGREKHQYSMGLEAGREEGRQMGLEEGTERGRRETAKNFKAMGLSVDQIAAATGLDPEVIEAL